MALFPLNCMPLNIYQLEPGVTLDSSVLYWLVLCVKLTQAGVITEKGASGEEMPPWDPAVRYFLNQWSRGEGPVHCEWCHPWASSPGFYRKAGWARPEKQANKKFPSVASVLAPALLKFLISSNDELWCGSGSQINPFLSNLLFGHSVSSQQ